MTFILLAAVPAAILTAMYLFERRAAYLLSARTAVSTRDNAVNGRR